MTHLRTILWNHLSKENYDCCSLSQVENGFQLEGFVILVDNNLPMRIRYHVQCDIEWKTQFAALTVWKGDHEETVTLKVDDQRWWRNEQEQTDFHGLLDVDLGFTPATNTLPIRRIKLKEGESETTTTVWVQFPSLEISRFPQRYTRLAHDEYLFESLDNAFEAKLKVDEFGLVTNYETLWDEIVHTG